MLKRYYLLILFVINTGFLGALPVVINGESAAGDAFVFRLYVQKDAFSGLEYIADQQRPDVDGRFMLGFEAQEIQEVSIKVGFQSLSFFVIPGHTYNLKFNDIVIDGQNVFLPQHPLHVVFQQEDMLNVVMDGFDYDYQKFLEENFLKLVKYRDKKIYQEFVAKLKLKLAETPLKDSLSRKYFEDYIYYKKAELRLAANLEKKDHIGMEVLANQPMLLNNPAYTDFFKKYFVNYLIEYNDGVDYDRLLRLINIGLPINTLLDVLGKDPVLVQEKLRETVLLLSLKQVFYHKDFNPYSINDIFLYMADNSKFVSVRLMAENLNDILNRFDKGREVPYFELPDLNAHKKAITDYHGKKLYLMFVSPECETCELDIEIMKTVKEEFPNDLDVVCVLVDFDKEKAEKWAKKQDANWDFLWFNDDYKMLSSYQVKTFPKYMMLDEKARLFNYYPPKPRGRLISYMKAICEKENIEREDSKDLFRKN